ncbi:MAG: carbonic anhydrase [Bacteroidota bacterium]
MKFGTLINCIDGRVQYPVMDYLKSNYDIEYFDAANEAGPLLTLTKKTDKCRLISLKEQIRTSLEEHDSKFIALVGHHDCTDNPGDRAFQEAQIDEALDYLRRGFGKDLTFVGLYVNEQWEVEEYVKILPEE